MDVRQYGPALFASVKQVRQMLEQEHLPPAHTRRETGEDAVSNSYDDSRAGVGK
jgi:hypothetical protein